MDSKYDILDMKMSYIDCINELRSGHLEEINFLLIRESSCDIIVTSLWSSRRGRLYGYEL